LFFRRKLHAGYGKSGRGKETEKTVYPGREVGSNEVKDRSVSSKGRR